MKILGMWMQNYASFHGRHFFNFSDRGLLLVLGKNHDDPRSQSNGCLSGATLVDCPRDLTKYPRGVPIKDLVGTTPWVYAWKDGRIVVRQASRVWLTKTAPVVRVRLTPFSESRRGIVTPEMATEIAARVAAGEFRKDVAASLGVSSSTITYALRRTNIAPAPKFLPPQELVGTADHPVLLADGKTWKALGELRPGDSLCSLYRRESGGWRSLIYWTGSGTMKMGTTTGAQTFSEQQFICEQRHGPKPGDDFEAHHVDDNPWNHSMGNLEWVPRGQHQSEHTSKRNKMGLAGWKVSGNHPRGMKGKSHSVEKRAQIAETMRKGWARRRELGINHTVLAVEDAGTEDVYDMTVPDADSFVANGVVVHNSGKSTLCDALEWCLFGETPRGDGAESVVNAQAGKGLCVTVHVLADDGKLLQVQRLRDYPKHKNGPRLWVDGKEVTRLDASATQEQIEQALGLDLQVFRAAVNFGQGNTFNFADSPDSQRKEILTKVLQLDDIDVWAARIDEKITAENAKLQAATKDADKYQALLEAWRARLESVQAQVAQWGSTHARDLVRAHEDFTRCDATLNHYVSALAAHPPAPPPAPAFDLTALQATRAQEASARTAYARAEAELEQWRNRFDILHVKAQTPGTPATCSACGQPLTPAHAEAELARREQAAQQALDERTRAEATRARLDLELSQAMQTLRAHEAQAQQHHDLHKAAALEAQRHQMDLAALQRDHARASQDRHNTILTYEAILQRTNPYEAEVAGAMTAIADFGAQERLAKDAQATSARELAHLAYWKYGFGPKGLKSHILDTQVEHLSAEANRWVSLLTGGTVWVRFETQKEVGTGAKKRLSDSLTLRVFRHNPDGTTTERNYRSWSGGEKQRIALGVDFGLARLVAKRAKRGYNLLLLDEVLQKSLDNAGKEAVGELLAELAKEKETILVIDHDPIFQGLFEETLVVEKRNGCSRIVGVTSEQQTAAQGIRSDDKVLANHPAFP